MSANFVSVIIPVYNDSERLKLCLQALENQTYSKDLYEVIVVDNASTEDIKSVVNQFSQAKYTYENKPGSYVARNKGITISKGDIIAFTDADCIPSLDWIEKGTTKLLKTSNCGLVGGKIEVIFKNQTQPTIIELYDSITAFPQQYFIEKDKFGATANVFTFKSVIDSIGGFNNGLKSNGDREWGNRVSFQYKLIYAEDTCVCHPARYTYTQMQKKYARLVGGQYDLQKKQNIYSFSLFAKYLIWDFMDSIEQSLRALFGKNIFKSSELRATDTLQKIELTKLILFIRYVMITERIRLHFGGESDRG
ncbi:glycosyltransferase [Plectonema cf. radiosum LEGE 06105]|uniref:Glycosyltransferase n=1 Tax=Plectonema cf. radiosum LEGE 06105 TaxID=945769 RepID=A0A8J7F7R4_9CYAN|nr:glycosyltransferase [Plectonema radiosum]MBE9213109.1 glycosyltransferase [Plectonema cf. radiosum LEGE 06105]